jgi:hypothetical protein
MPKQVAAYDDSRVKYALEKAPEVFQNEIQHWLNKERVNFLGFKGHKAASDGGGIRGKLLNKPRFMRTGDWAPQVVGQFKSFTENKGSLNPRMTMEFSEGSPLLKAMKFLEVGGSVTNSKFMPIPAYDILRQTGITGSFYKQFKTASEAGDLIPIHPRGMPNILYWISKKFGQLQFIGHKNITIKKQFDFHNAWNKRSSKVVVRGEQAIYRATRKIEKMIREGKIAGGF